MLKKRLVFTLLYDSGYFMLSRNFRLQRVGDIKWLQQNYNFTHIAYHIDELIVLDVSRKARDPARFFETLKEVAAGCFVPIAAGGGVLDVAHARALLRSGADKIVVNSALFRAPDLVAELAQDFGQQCVVGSVDVRRDGPGRVWCWLANGQTRHDEPLESVWPKLLSQPVGEFYFNSIDQDGTGQGYDIALLDQLPAPMPVPLILAGGVGNASHLAQGLRDARVDAIATANLFNFVGDGLARARAQLRTQGFSLASWPAPVVLRPGGES